MKNKVFNEHKIVEAFIKKETSKMKLAIVFYYPSLSLDVDRVKEVIGNIKNTDDNEFIITDLSKETSVKVSQISYKISLHHLDDIVSVFKNGKMMSFDDWKAETQPIPYDKNSEILLSEKDFLNFLNTIKNPPVANNKLKEALKKKR